MLPELYELKQKLIKENIQGIAMDIDETLSWTMGYWLKDMQRLFGNPENLSVEEMEAKYKYAQNVPYWQSEEITEWIIEQCFSDELQKELPLIKGADKAVDQIHRIMPVVAYITVRPDSVINGTKYWLKKHGFPKAPIIAKPRYVYKSEGNAWKADVLNYLSPEIKGIVDDNPGLVENLPDSYTGKVFIYNAHTVPNGDKRAVACKDWNSVVDKIKEFKTTI